MAGPVLLPCFGMRDAPKVLPSENGYMFGRARTAPSFAVRPSSVHPRIHSARQEYAAKDVAIGEQRPLPEGPDISAYLRQVENAKRSQSPAPKAGYDYSLNARVPMSILPSVSGDFQEGPATARAATVTVANDLVPPEVTHVAVVSPGAGTGMNRVVFDTLRHSGRFSWTFVGRSRDVYDRYPESWPTGCPAPNLMTFAKEEVWPKLKRLGSQCLLCGSRGGQVVLPFLWQVLKSSAPPAIVINGGCAMALPESPKWPRQAVTFLLLGGQDYFRGDKTPEEYVERTKDCVPEENLSTAILYVEEMLHMPQAELLARVLPAMLWAIRKWRETSQLPLQELTWLLSTLRTSEWSGRLLWKRSTGGWSDFTFGSSAGKRAAHRRK